MSISSTIFRMVRGFAVFWRLTELRGVMACARIEARTGINAGDAAVMAVGALALIFVLAVVQGDASPGMSAPQGNARIQTPARANGARQQECEAKEDQGPRPLVKQCGPLV